VNWSALDAKFPVSVSPRDSCTFHIRVRTESDELTHAPQSAGERSVVRHTLVTGNVFRHELTGRVRL
jgi:hypothetical protein